MHHIEVYLVSMFTCTLLFVIILSNAAAQRCQNKSSKFSFGWIFCSFWQTARSLLWIWNIAKTTKTICTTKKPSWLLSCERVLAWFLLFGLYFVYFIFFFYMQLIGIFICFQYCVIVCWFAACLILNHHHHHHNPRIFFFPQTYLIHREELLWDKAKFSSSSTAHGLSPTLDMS